jgi:hypothetical protein
MGLTACLSAAREEEVRRRPAAAEGDHGRMEGEHARVRGACVFLPGQPGAPLPAGRSRHLRGQPGVEVLFVSVVTRARAELSSPGGRG